MINAKGMKEAADSESASLGRLIWGSGGDKPA